MPELREVGLAKRIRMTPNTQQNSRELAEKIVEQWLESVPDDDSKPADIYLTWLIDAIAPELHTILERVEKVEKERDELVSELSRKRWLIDQLTPESIERTKEDLDGSATHDVLLLATALRVLQEGTDEHANELSADGFVLKSDEAKQRAAEYEQAYWALCRVWPTELTETLFESERDQLAKDKARLVEACRPLLFQYLANPGTKHEFVTMVSNNEETLQHWRNLAALLKEME